VIDASVAQASGEGAQEARPCRDFLLAVLKVCCRIVLSDEGREEWERHMSNFASDWLTKMVSKRKDYRTGTGISQSLKTRVLSTADGAEREAMEKDWHLIEAALDTDRMVASLDDEARGLFKSAARQVGGIGGVVWVNPKELKDPKRWLLQSNQALRQWQLRS